MEQLHAWETMASAFKKKMRHEAAVQVRKERQPGQATQQAGREACANRGLRGEARIDRRNSRQAHCKTAF